MSNYAGCVAVLDAVERWWATKEEGAKPLEAHREYVSSVAPPAYRKR